MVVRWGTERNVGSAQRVTVRGWSGVIDSVSGVAPISACASRRFSYIAVSCGIEHRCACGPAV
jgi:hypothetical protein